MRQLLYVSTSLVGVDQDETARILLQSRKHNGLYGVTGMLWTDGHRFAQVLEGNAEVVTETMERIRRDPRHCDITIAVDRQIDVRQFGHWAMVHAENNPFGVTFGSRAVDLLGRIGSSLADTWSHVVVNAYPPSTGNFA